jgi:hypothetical protein
MSHSAVAFPASDIRVSTLWISDEEVRQIFRRYRLFYSQTNGTFRQEADAVYVREQRSKEGTLGLVYYNPISRDNWLWVISKKTRAPFKLARVG